MSIKCPKCGQPIKEEKDKEYVECFICKTKINLPKTEMPKPETPQQTTTAKPIHQPVYAQPVQQPQQHQSQKPNQGFCVQCHSTNLTFNDDGNGKCNSCGRVFNWKQQQQYWQQQMYMPRCFRCGNPNLQYFPDGRTICSYCQQKYRWSYDYYGRVILREMDLLDDLH